MKHIGEPTSHAGFGKPGSIASITFWTLPIQMRKEAIVLLREMGEADRAIARHFGLTLKSMQGLLDAPTRPFRGMEDMAEGS